ncbi:hypothetical protein PC119_g22163 [Phytophthora cactorum]|uniref:Reverse transcriptase domain-containing protein n=2 Tax=Phytophthora cactorum TaxID=29920 RepID=A0A8T1EE94_9STRA|nr:hypothetical protein PC117_g5071 [Phytophthora cactorum]KAG2976501.1 hypothetical protein PC119_g22163 [Phytophthora cactorum]
METLQEMSAGQTSDTTSSVETKERFNEQSWDSLKASPFFDALREHKDVLPDKIHAELPHNKGMHHEIDLVPGTKYCVTRQWSLPRDQVKATDDFFESRRQAGQVRESKSPHSASTFCVKKPQGGWRIVHAYKKLNGATIPVQTPIPRNVVIIDSMAKSTIYSALDLRDGFYQILMRESDIALPAVSTPSVKSPHISQRMARWLSFFTEYDFRVEYKPGRLNVVADALSRRPDYAVKTANANRIGVERVSAPSSSMIDDVKAAYASDADAKQLLSYVSAPSDEARRKLTPHLRTRAHRYRVHE